MMNIIIDFEVFKELTTRRASENITYNDVLRDLLGLKTIEKKAPKIPDDAWIVKNVIFPSDTEFRGNYKGKTFLGRVRDGSLLVDGKPYNSPSAAACAVTGNNVNGWTFWECRFPGEENWEIITALKK